MAAEALLLVAIVDGELVPVVEVEGVLVDVETGAPLDPAEMVLVGLDVAAA